MRFSTSNGEGDGKDGEGEKPKSSPPSSSAATTANKLDPAKTAEAVESLSSILKDVQAATSTGGSSSPARRRGEAQSPQPPSRRSGRTTTATSRDRTSQPPKRGETDKRNKPMTQAKAISEVEMMLRRKEHGERFKRAIGLAEVDLLAVEAERGKESVYEYPPARLQELFKKKIPEYYPKQPGLDEKLLYEEDDADGTSSGAKSEEGAAKKPSTSSTAGHVEEEEEGREKDATPSPSSSSAEETVVVEGRTPREAKAEEEEEEELEEVVEEEEEPSSGEDSVKGAKTVQLTAEPEDQAWARVKKAHAKSLVKPSLLIDAGTEIHFMNPWFLSRFISVGGKIMPRYQTGLTAKQQRKLAKEIKRAREVGLLPYMQRYYPDVDSDLKDQVVANPLDRPRPPRRSLHGIRPIPRGVKILDKTLEEMPIPKSLISPPSTTVLDSSHQQQASPRR